MRFANSHPLSQPAGSPWVQREPWRKQKASTCDKEVPRGASLVLLAIHLQAVGRQRNRRGWEVSFLDELQNIRPMLIIVGRINCFVNTDRCGEMLFMIAAVWTDFQRFLDLSYSSSDFKASPDMG